MKTIFTFFALSSILFSTNVMASYDLAFSGKPVKCYGPDNIEIILNAQRTSVKYIIEGESAGAKRIRKTSTDNKTYVSYTTSEGTLTLGEVDTFSDREGTTASSEPYEVKCK